LNGKQRARWAADITLDLQRLQKAARGGADAPALGRAAEALGEARLAALAESGAESEACTPGAEAGRG
jgi:hypothetical protein